MRVECQIDVDKKNLQKQKLESQFVDENGRNRLNDILVKTTEISERAVKLREQLM